MLRAPDLPPCLPLGACERAVWQCDPDDPQAPVRCVQVGAAEEICDGLDNDCDGELPDNERDGDGDGVPPCRGDCADDHPGVHPGQAADPAWGDPAGGGAGPLEAVPAPLDLCADGADWDCSGPGGDGREDEPECPIVALPHSSVRRLAAHPERPVVYVSFAPGPGNPFKGGVVAVDVAAMGEEPAGDVADWIGCDEPGGLSVVGDELLMTDAAAVGLWRVDLDADDQPERNSHVFEELPPSTPRHGLREMVRLPDRGEQRILVAGEQGAISLDPAAPAQAVELGGLGGHPPYLLRSHALQDVALLAAQGGGGEHGGGALQWLDGAGTVLARVDPPSTPLAVALWSVRIDKPGRAAAALANSALWGLAYPDPSDPLELAGVGDDVEALAYAPGLGGLLYVARPHEVEVADPLRLTVQRAVDTGAGLPSNRRVTDLSGLEVRDLITAEWHAETYVLLLLSPPEGAAGTAWLLWIR